MEQIILSGLTFNDLLNGIERLIDKKLAISLNPVKKETKYLSRIEVCKLLKITLPTLSDWSKLGRVQSYKIGNRVLYKEEEIENALHQVSSLKFKRG
jgi:excisionase family DNA binding protein